MNSTNQAQVLFLVTFELVAFVLVVAAGVILWLFFRHQKRAQKRKEQLPTPLPSDLKEESKPRTLDELISEMEVKKHYAYFPGWLSMDELDLLWEAGFKLIYVEGNGEGYIFEITKKEGG